jgi:hypothetical protein
MFVFLQRCNYVGLSRRSPALVVGAKLILKTEAKLGTVKFILLQALSCHTLVFAMR